MKTNGILLALFLSFGAGITATQAITFTVETVADTGAGSLRQAVIDAAALAGEDTIVFDGGLNAGTILVNSEIVIDDQDGVIIDASGLADGITLDGGTGTNRIFAVVTSSAYGTAAVLKHLTLTGGSGTGALFSGNGGAILVNNGSLEMTDCVFSGNTASGRGGAICANGHGVTIDRCTFTGNSASDNGGAFANGFNSSDGVAVLTQCTFTGNSALNSTNGGAIYNQATTTLVHCTVSDNFAENAAGGISGVSSGILTLDRCLVAGTLTPFAGSKDVRNSGNLTLIGINHVIILNNSGSITGSGSLSTEDPLLVALADNGGYSQTMALQRGSPAINAGTGSGITSDQRGFPLSGTADLGAFEYQQSSNADLTSVTLSDGTLSPSFDNGTTSYTAVVVADVTELTLTPTAVDSATSILVGGDPVISGNPSAAQPVALGETVITMDVTSEDGSQSRSFTFTITRLPADTDSDGNGFTDLQEYRL
ncbi:MAG: cadherin-like beta sandwich domain-containing protein [Verrucomicrobiae bacterium]|nr:cadherin-like beta sandwich domain-containing protein [Verrucomicrobiae bacterium]